MRVVTGLVGGRTPALRQHRPREGRRGGSRDSGAGAGGGGCLRLLSPLLLEVAAAGLGGSRPGRQNPGSPTGCPRCGAFSGSSGGGPGPSPPGSGGAKERRWRWWPCLCSKKAGASWNPRRPTAGPGPLSHPGATCFSWERRDLWGLDLGLGVPSRGPRTALLPWQSAQGEGVSQRPGGRWVTCPATAPAGGETWRQRVPRALGRFSVTFVLCLLQQRRAQ